MELEIDAGGEPIPNQRRSLTVGRHTINGDDRFLLKCATAVGAPEHNMDFCGFNNISTSFQRMIEQLEEKPLPKQKSTPNIFSVTHEPRNKCIFNFY